MARVARKKKEKMVRIDWPANQVLPLRLVRLILDEQPRLFVSVIDVLSVALDISIQAAARLWYRFSLASRKQPVTPRVFVANHSTGVFFQFKHSLAAIDHILVRRRCATMTKQQQRVRWQETCSRILATVQECTNLALLPRHTSILLHQCLLPETPVGIILVVKQEKRNEVKIDSDVDPARFLALLGDKEEAKEVDGKEEEDESDSEWEQEVTDRQARGRKRRRTFVRDLAKKYDVSLSEYYEPSVNVLTVKRRTK